MPGRSYQEKLTIKDGQIESNEGLWTIFTEPKLCLHTGVDYDDNYYRLDYKLVSACNKDIVESLKGTEVGSADNIIRNNCYIGRTSLESLVSDIASENHKDGTYLIEYEYDHFDKGYNRGHNYWNGTLYEVNMDSPYIDTFLNPKELQAEGNAQGMEMVNEAKKLIGVSPTDPALIKATGLHKYDEGMSKDEFEAYKKEIISDPARLQGKDRQELLDQMMKGHHGTMESVAVPQKIIDSELKIASTFFYGSKSDWSTVANIMRSRAIDAETVKEHDMNEISTKKVEKIQTLLDDCTKELDENFLKFTKTFVNDKMDEIDNKENSEYENFLRGRQKALKDILSQIEPETTLSDSDIADLNKNLSKLNLTHDDDGHVTEAKEYRDGIDGAYQEASEILGFELNHDSVEIEQTIAEASEIPEQEEAEL